MKTIHPYFKHVFKHIVLWTVALALFRFLREYGQVVENGLSQRFTVQQYIGFQLLIGATAGTLFGSYAYVIEHFISRRLSFGRLVLLSSIGYVLIIMCLIFIAFTILSTLIDRSLGVEDLQVFLANGNHRVLILYCFIVGFLIEFFQQVDLKFGPGNLWKMLKGTYYRPIEEERVLMFLDMRSSTTIAEKLGHITYSRLVQDCFKDIRVIADFGGQVYQYVGDEAVLTWEGGTGFKDNQCIKAYFAFCDQLESRRAHYMNKYGFVPEFKAGMNVGLVTTAEVGDIKREIAFHGDTINTAARIQGMCNDLGCDFLASKAVIERLGVQRSFDVEPVGELELRGKRTKVQILSIDRR